MNYMESKDSIIKLRQLSLSVGEFIRYWGFRRIHGAIWTQLYLSKDPLSCTDLTQRLDHSKALISPALDELLEFDLIYEVPGPNLKVKTYTAKEDVVSVIKNILKTRENQLIKKVNKDYDRVKKASSKDDGLSAQRLDNLAEMLVSANLMLQILIQEEDLIGLPREIEKC